MDPSNPIVQLCVAGMAAEAPYAQLVRTGVTAGRRRTGRE
jgi:hypothetical protein